MKVSPAGWSLSGMLLAGCLAVAGCSTTAGAAGSTGAAATPVVMDPACPLTSAPEPGNSRPPAGVPMAESAPGLEQKGSYAVAFSQNASNNPWRLAETESMREEAQRLGLQMSVTDANNTQAKQIQDVKSLIAQRPDALFIAPITEQLANVVVEAAAADVPVFLLDREVNTAVATPGKDFVTVIRSDFVQEGRRAGWAMARATGGRAKIIELEGTTGSSPAIDRKRGFTEAIASCPGLEVVTAQDADFSRATGMQVAETLLQAHPDATAIYEHNDEMALGAIAALRSAGKVPGRDVKIVSIDGSRDALEAIIRGELFASVECNPRFGPIAFQTIAQYAAGEPVSTVLINEDRLFTAENAQQFVDEAF